MSIACARARNYDQRSSSSSVLNGLVTSCCDSFRSFVRRYHENLGRDSGLMRRDRATSVEEFGNLQCIASFFLTRRALLPFVTAPLRFSESASYLNRKRSISLNFIDYSLLFNVLLIASRIFIFINNRNATQSSRVSSHFVDLSE